MIQSNCQHEKKHVHGKTKTGAVRYKCALCGKTFTASTNLLDGMRIGLDRAAQIINLLCEGMSVRAVSRITDTHMQTITDLLVIFNDPGVVRLQGWVLLAVGVIVLAIHLYQD